MPDINSPIDPNSIGYMFSLSTWQSLISFIFLLVFTATIFYISFKLKKRNLSILVSFIFGIVGMIIFGLIFSQTPPQEKPIDFDDVWITWDYEVRNWLTLYSNLFISGILLIVPLYIFVAIVNFIIDEKNNKISKKTYFVSIFLLIILPIIGILIALLMIPIVNNINIIMDETGEIWDSQPQNITEIISSSIGSSLDIFLSTESLLSILIFAIIIGFIIKSFKKNNSDEDEENLFESSQRFFIIFKKIIVKYLKVIMLILPFAIGTRLSIMLMTKAPNENIKLVTLWLSIYTLGSIIIFIIFNSISLLISSNEINKKEKIRSLFNHFVFTLANPNTIVALNSTQETTKKLGVSEEMALLTPTKGTLMGLTMCSGFMPMLTLLFTTKVTGEAINFNLILIATIIIFTISIGTIGMNSVDSVTVISALSALNMSSVFYLSIVFVLAPITEIIATINNTSGHIMSTIIADKTNNKIKK